MPDNNKDTIIKKVNDTEAFFKNTLLSQEDSSPKIGWFCTYTPEELIIACGFTPVRIFGSKKLEKSESYFPINFCPYLKSGWEAVMASGSSFKGFVFTNSCDGMRRFYDTANKYYSHTPSYMIDVPRIQNEKATGFFKYNLDNTAKSLEKLGGNKISGSRLEDAVVIMDDKRRALQEFSDLFKKLPGLISISTYYKIMKLSMVSSPEVFNRELKEYINSLKKIKASPTGSSAPNIMIIGNFITEEKLWDMFSSLDLKLASEDLCVSNRYFQGLVSTRESRDLMGAIAARYLNKPGCMRMADLGKKLKSLENNIKDNKINGVIFISLKFCDTVLYSFPLIKQKLGEFNIPTLYLEIEYGNFSEGQIKTRAEAFLEML